MTLNGAIMQLVELSEHPMMPVLFRPAIQKVIETISELEQPEPRKDVIAITNLDFFRTATKNQIAYLLCNIISQNCGQCIAADHCFFKHNGYMDWLDDEMQTPIHEIRED